MGKIRLLQKVTFLGSSTLRIVEDPSGTPVNRDVTIGADDYWLHSTNHGTYTGLYYELQSALDALSTANAYEFRAGTPSLSYDRHGEGVTLVRTAGTTDYQIDWSNSTLDARVMGFPNGYSSSVNNSGNLLQSQYTRWGDWVPARPIQISERDPRSYFREATDDMSRDNWYQVDHGGLTVRHFMMNNLPAANILDTHAENRVYAGVAELAEGDTHQALEKWHQAVEDGSTFLVVYEDADESLELGAQWEALKLYGVEARSNFRNLISRQSGRGGEFYDVRFTGQIITSSYDL